MKLVFFGTGPFALPALRALAPHISLVVTQPDRPTGRGMKLQPSAAKLIASELNIPCETPEKARVPEFVARIRAEEADALLVASYGQILSQAVLDSAKIGGINLHGSILPKYRGAAPIQRSIQNGEKESGVTLMQMDKGMDTGDIIEIARTPIDPDETYGELQDRLALIACDLAVKWMERIVTGDYPRTPQNWEDATLAAKVNKIEAELRFDEDARSEYNRYRAFSPAPGPFLCTSLGKVKVLKAGFSDAVGEPGTVLAVNPNLSVAFAHGSIELIEVQPEGKKRMSGKDFANGARLKVGTRLI